ncbi:Galactitol-1-phosphate 5-dehydrogenase [Oceanobacillus oncorhynchi]|uniref:Galactitol-1-phosphate 5-dehydrogenase n=1 Tax=Oceanobacillus oncorhynchi TaxID=545501 RepID=A0A0A1MSV9_9BACI|nr:galactitol-1-phosphate 5-dehydrogenase [Oceanobacillus oncorhynchi]CEI82066.1 Galactitol-1-phosphate 5-dehydrogenase [Oceanobacillus oncorhynchi]
MKALVLESKANFSVKDMEIPVIKPNQVLVKVAYVGICGSDLARYFDGKVHHYPTILGHEFSGVITETGSEVQGLNEGDRVAVAPLVPCEQCSSCASGHPALCENYSFIGSREQGAMAEYVAVNAKNILTLPDEITDQEAALIEPLTVAIHGIEKVDIHAGASAVVFGAGTIGMMSLLALQAKGAGEITVIDIDNAKLEMAKALGATVIVNSLEVDLDDYFKENQRPEIVVETAGVQQTQVQSLSVVEKLGQVVYVGTAKKEITFPADVFERILRAELKVYGSWMSYSAPFPGFEWTAALQYMKDGKIDVKALIHEVNPLEVKEEPFQKMIDPDNHSIKFLYDVRQ